MTDIEKKEIRGLNVRNLLLVIGATATIVITTVTWCAKISGQIEVIKNDSNSEKRYNDLRISIMERSLESLRLSLDNLKTKNP